MVVDRGRRRRIEDEAVLFARQLVHPVVLRVTLGTETLRRRLSESERRTYLAESLFLNTVKYENDKLEAYMKKLSRK